MHTVRYKITKEQGIARKGYVKTYTSNIFELVRDESLNNGATYSMYIKDMEGNTLFAGGMSYENGRIYRQLDDEDFDDMQIIFARMGKKRIHLNLEITENATVAAIGEIELAAWNGLDRIVYEDNSRIDLDDGILLNEGAY